PRHPPYRQLRPVPAGRVLRRRSAATAAAAATNAAPTPSAITGTRPSPMADVAAPGAVAGSAAVPTMGGAAYRSHDSGCVPSLGSAAEICAMPLGGTVMVAT